MDLALAGLMVAVAYMVVARAFVRAADNGSSVSGGGEPVSLDALKPKAVAERAVYQRIAANNLFGEAGKLLGAAVSGGDDETEPSEDVQEAPPTLRLLGTTTGSPKDPLGSAQIENAAARTVDKVGTFFVGDGVTDDHTLYEIYPRKVILQNKKENRFEVLRQREDSSVSGAVKTASGAPVPGAGGPAATPGHINLKRDDLLREFTTNGAELVRLARPAMYTDAQGNIAGITSDNLNNIPLARQVGLQNGDVVQAVNGVNIDSEEKLAEIFTRFENASVFRLNVLRNGKVETINVKLD